MAELTSAAAEAAALPDPSAIERAEAFTREPFLHDGEDAAVALAPASARRRALDAALAEIEAGAKVPSTRWRRRYALLLGLERPLSQDAPRLADGTTLNPHQVDALSGTLTALLAAAQNEHATGAGKTVAAMGFVEASRTGGILILTHRRNLVDQFLGELRTRGYAKREAPPLLDGAQPPRGAGAGLGPVTVETYQWFVRNAGRISDAYTIVICDEAHTALGEKTSAAIRAWTGPIFIGMTATGALIARHVTDLFPTQTSRFDLAQAARRGVIAPLRCVRIPPGPGVRTIAKVPLRKGEVDQDFDQEELAALLDQGPFNAAVADLYRVRFRNLPGIVYAAGVRHAYNVAKAFQDAGIKAKGVSGETPKRELTRILAAYERGEIDVLVNAQLLAEGGNSPRARVCMPPRRPRRSASTSSAPDASPAARRARR